MNEFSDTAKETGMSKITPEVIARIRGYMQDDFEQAMVEFHHLGPDMLWEIEQLREENFRLAAGQCSEVIGDECGHTMCRILGKSLDSLKSGEQPPMSDDLKKALADAGHRWVEYEKELDGVVGVEGDMCKVYEGYRTFFWKGGRWAKMGDFWVGGR